jgi:hypothetical protein
MHSVLTGAYGSDYNIHLYFINSIYAYFLHPFYVFFPKIGWFSLFEKAIVFLSFSVILHTVLQYRKSKWILLCVILLELCVALDFYLHVEFTRCAGIASATGIFLIATGNNKRKWNDILLGCAFLTTGYIFRSQMFLLGLPTLATILLFDWLVNKKIWKKTFIVLAIFAMAILGIKTFDSNQFADSDYRYYAEYQKVRAFFGDGAFYDFNVFCDELDERGIGCRNARYLRSWYFYDNDVFSLDSLNSLIQIAQRSVYKPNLLKFPFAVARTISDSLIRSSVWFWLLLCYSIILFSKKNYKYAPWLSIILVGISYSYLLVVNRVVNHVESGIWAYAVVFILFFTIQDFDIEKRNQR